jgi:hypothetical protein
LSFVVVVLCVLFVTLSLEAEKVCEKKDARDKKKKNSKIEKKGKAEKEKRKICDNSKFGKYKIER